MSIFKYYTEEDIFFSRINGQGIYEATGNYVEPEIRYESDGGQCIELKNIITGEVFFGKTVFTDEIGSLWQYITSIIHSDDSDLVNWPKDIVDIPSEKHSNNTVYVPIEYVNAEKRKIQFGDAKKKQLVLFKPGFRGDSITIEEHLKHIGKMNYDNPSIKTLIKGILEAFISLNSKGYIYIDFDFRRMRLRSEGRVAFDYSDLLYYLPPESDTKYVISRGGYPVEFMESNIVSGNGRYADEHIQNYSLAALLFYLMYGRYPYDGKRLAGESDTSKLEHKNKFAVYHKVAEFIFDENKNNALSATLSESDTVKLWNRTPEKIKEMFENILCHENAMREIDESGIGNLNANSWMKVLQEHKMI